MYTLLRCLLQSKEALFVSYFWNLLSLGISWPGQLWQPLAVGQRARGEVAAPRGFNPSSTNSLTNTSILLLQHQSTCSWNSSKAAVVKILVFLSPQSPLYLVCLKHQLFDTSVIRGV